MLIKYEFDIPPEYWMNASSASWIKEFEFGTSGKLLMDDSRSKDDFQKLVTDSDLTASEIKKLKIKFGANNQITAFILKELDENDLLKIKFAGLEKLGCFYTNSGDAFKAENFRTYLSKHISLKDKKVGFSHKSHFDTKKGVDLEIHEAILSQAKKLAVQG